MVSTIIPELRTASELSIYLLAKHNYDMAAKPPIDVDKVAQLLNINVDESRLSSDSNKDVIGKITLDKGMPATVWMNPVENSYPPRRRFTLAHEIGHFCMPEKLIRSIGQKTINEYMEKHNAKMPLDDFISTMAVHFHVSNPAMTYRLRSFGVGKKRAA